MDFSIRQVTRSSPPVARSEPSRSFEPPSSTPPSSPLPPLPHTPPYVHSFRFEPSSLPLKGPFKQVSLPDLRPSVARSKNHIRRHLSNEACPSDDAEFLTPSLSPGSRLRRVVNSDSESWSDELSNTDQNPGARSIEPQCSSIPSLSLHDSSTDDVLASLPSPSLFNRSVDGSRVTTASRLRFVQSHTTTSIQPIDGRSVHNTDSRAEPRAQSRKGRRANASSVLARSALFIPDTATIPEAKVLGANRATQLDAERSTLACEGSIRTSNQHIAAQRDFPPAVAQACTPHIRVATNDLAPPDINRSATISIPFGTRELRPRSSTPVRHPGSLPSIPISISSQSQDRSFSRQRQLLPPRPDDQSSFRDLDFGFAAPPTTVIKLSQPHPSQDLTSLPQLPDATSDPSTAESCNTRYSDRFFRPDVGSRSKRPTRSLSKPAKLRKPAPGTHQHTHGPARLRTRPHVRTRSRSYPTIAPLSLPLPSLDRSEQDLISPHSASLYPPEPSRLQKTLFVLLTVGFVLVATGAVLAGVIWRLGRVGR